MRSRTKCARFAPVKQVNSVSLRRRSRVDSAGKRSCRVPPHQKTTLGQRQQATIGRTRAKEHAERASRKARRFRSRRIDFPATRIVVNRPLKPDSFAFSTSVANPAMRRHPVKTLNSRLRSNITPFTCLGRLVGCVNRAQAHLRSTPTIAL